MTETTETRIEKYQQKPVSRRAFVKQQSELGGCLNVLKRYEDVAINYSTEYRQTILDRNNRKKPLTDYHQWALLEIRALAIAQREMHGPANCITRVSDMAWELTQKGYDFLAREGFEAGFSYGEILVSKGA